ncbi:MAG: hypothetical protein IKA94_02050 [Mogibacterium sp.]|nr:hypothetical protein [Mogibacterium sp.]
MRTLICIPCMDMVHTAFMQSLLSMRMVGEVRFAISCSSLIYDARNKLADQAIDGGYDRCLWLDSDMVFPADTMERLGAHLDNGLEAVCGIYFSRKAPVTPIIYDNCGWYESDGKSIPTAHAFFDYPKDQLVEIEGMGFGEDLSFCGRVIDSGRKIYCDTSIKCGHIAQSLVNEETYETMGGARRAEHSKTGDPSKN